MIDLVSGTEDYNYTAYSGRKQVWARANIYIQRHPAMGVGIANFPIMEGQYLEEHGKVGKWSAAHNAYYQATVELGLPGGLMFISMLLIAIYKGWRLRRAFRDSASGERLNRRSMWRPSLHSRCRPCSCRMPTSTSCTACSD